MKIALFIIGLAIILLVLWDVFETIVLPRRVTRRFRLTRLFYRSTWVVFSGIVFSAFSPRRREVLLSYYGPLSLILLLSIWAGGVIAGFALMHWGAASAVKAPEGGALEFSTYLYLSGSNFFTLGIGDVTPVSIGARLMTILEAGLGLGLLALVIGYLPSLNQSFSRREASISLLDARAGSPPTAAEMMRRQCRGSEFEALLKHFVEWEQWSAELLESHLSYPVLAYFRSQHTNQSWIGALTAILDTSALVIAGTEGACARQAQLTFAIARHTLVDLSFVFFCAPKKMKHDRLPSAEFEALRNQLAEAGLRISKGRDTEQRLVQLREIYEPYVFSLSHYFHVAVPPWMPKGGLKDNWQTSAWETGKGFKIGSEAGKAGKEHF